MKILVRNLDRSTTEDELNALFVAFGGVQSSTLVLDKDTGVSKGFGFIEMPNAGEAKAAIKTLNNTTVGSQIIRVKKAQEKSAS
jgi:RNA recognition motif-containing protein